MSEDLRLQQRVIDELEFTPDVDAAHIGVAVRNGVVTLSGHVSSLLEKVRAEAAVRRVKGVLAIALDLDVRLPTDKKTADDEIAARAVHLLEWDTQLPHGAIKLSVSHGVVTLFGEVEWAFQRREAEADVRRLGGVRDVINDIHLRPQVRATDVSEEIHAAFERAADLDAEGIRVEMIGGGKVRLTGCVRSLTESRIAENAAWAVSGVNAVHSELRIVPTLANREVPMPAM